MVEAIGRIEVRIGDAVVDGRNARGARVGKPAYLHGSRLAGKDQEAIASHVHSQVHEDVDPVLTNPLGNLLVVKTGDAPPCVDIGTQSPGDPVRTHDIGIADDLEVLVGVRGEEGAQ